MNRCLQDKCCVLSTPYSLFFWVHILSPPYCFAVKTMYRALASGMWVEVVTATPRPGLWTSQTIPFSLSSLLLMRCRKFNRELQDFKRWWGASWKELFKVRFFWVEIPTPHLKLCNLGQGTLPLWAQFPLLCDSAFPCRLKGDSLIWDNSEGPSEPQSSL